jgi:drug/metabolite transporter (DMT)-like permease
MLLAPVLWSTAGVVTRHVERALPFEQVFWRSLFAFLFIAALLVGMKRQNLWKAALALTTTANALVVMSVGPLATALLARAFLSDPLPLRTWIAAFAASAGIVWMFSGNLESGHLAGMLVALVIPVASAVNVVTLRASAARLDLVPAVMLGGAISCLLALPFALPFSATPRDIALMAFLGVFQLGLPCMLLVIASRTLLAPEIALLGLLEVVLGPLWAWLGAGEVPAESTLLGGMIVLGALAANELPTLRVGAIRTRT